MVLLWLLAVARGAAPGSQHDLTSYLAIAAAYDSSDHTRALQEIRQWTPPDITSAVAELQEAQDRLRAVPTATDHIAFGTVEVAVLMHAEAGLAALQALSMAEAEVHLRASTSLFTWSRRAAATARNFAHVRAYLDVRHDRPTPGLPIRERIDPRDFYVALAAASLAIGFPETARPFAESARRAAPLDAEVQMVYGCVAESFADEQLLRHRESEVLGLQEEAGHAMLDALALDPGLHEARLRLGRLLLVRGGLIEAEPALEAVERVSTDERQRYLARLFLGRLAERRGRLDDAARLYAQALEGWPDSQAARLALAHALERQLGPAAARPVVSATLSASRRLDRAADPWWLYPFGPPGLAGAALDRVWKRALDR
jgi:tetratricopeptide (TPR) repeat protein